MMKTALSILTLIATFACESVSAANCTSIASGNWNARTTWGTAGTGCAGATGTPAGTPGANDDVTIANLNHTVVITDARQVGTLDFAGGAQPATLQIQNGGSLTTGNDVTINPPTAAVTKLIQLQATSSLTVNGRLDIDGGTAANRIAEVRVEGGSTLTVTDDVRLNGNTRSLLTFTGAGTLILGGNMSQSGTFTCAACTVTANGGANQTLDGLASGYTYFNIADQKTGGTLRFSENVTINGNITNAGRLSLTTNTPTITLGGGGLQTIGGTAATTFTSLTVNQAAGGSVALGQNITVNTTLTLTAGIIDAGASTVIMANTGATPIAGGSATSYVVGCLRKNYTAGQTLSFRAAGSDEFPVGIAGAYLPVEISSGTTSTAGNLVVCVTGTDHPQMTLANGGGIDTAKSVNRYWSMTSTTLTLSALMDATFKFPAGATQYDAGAATGSFLVQRYDGTDWNPTTLSAAAATSTRAQNINLTAGTNDFEIGEANAGFNANPGLFNVFETTTPGGAVLGRIYTKRASVNFTLSIVAVSNNGVNSAPSTNALTVEVVNSSGTPGAFSNNCWSGWPVLATTSVASPVGWAAGRVNVTISAPATAVRDVRIRVAQGGAVGCSTDRFSIRPSSFTVTSSDATNNGTSGTPAIKAGANFSLTATAIAGYDGTPSIDNTKVVGTTSAGSIGGSFGAAPVGTGVATGSAFTYSEVGNFGLNANAVYDSSFTSVDPSEDCTADFSNTLAGGRYGCSFGSTAVAQTTGSSGFGRFIPDHFFVASGSTLTNRSAAGCSPASTFTYMGEGMGFAFTLQARNSSGTVTQNYAGSYAKLNPATIAQLGFGAMNGTANLTSRLDTSVGSAGSFASGQAAVTATVAITRAVPDNPDGPFTTAKIGIAPSDSDAITARAADMSMDVDGAGGNDHVQIGGNTQIRFGRLRLDNAVGAETLPLTLPMRTDYWNGTTFATNDVDSCTTLARSDIALDFNPPSNLTACETAVNAATVSFSSGVGSVALTAPGSPNNGSVLLTVNLGSAGGSYCNPGSFVAASNAGRGYLLGRWNDAANPDGNANTMYDDKPSARAAFGLYGGQPNNFIYFRENY